MERSREMQQSSKATSARPQRREKVSLVALLLGVIFAVVLSAITAYTDGFLVGSELGGCHFPLGPVLVLFAVLLPAGWLLARIAHRNILTSGQLVATYSLLIVTAGIPTFGLALYLFPVMTGPFYMASPENKWAELIFPLLPQWIAPPAEGKAIKWFYDGAPPGMGIPWGEWLRPVAAWSVLVVGFFLAMFCLAALLRRQWVERENLIFPLVELPLEMTGAAKKFPGDIALLRSPLVWIGFAIPFLIHNLEALHAYIPAIPEIRLHRLPIFAGLTSPPWRYLRSFVYIHFSVIGVAYFLTTEISLSLWFFWWLGRLQHVVADALGREPMLRRVEENQYQGALIAIVAYGIWVARGHLVDAWRRAWQGDGEDAAEAMPYRWIFLGLILAGVIVGGWLMVAGVSFAMVLFAYIVFLVICWGMARLVAESGIMFAKVVQMRPTLLIRGLIGARNVRPRDLAVLNVVEYVFMYDLKSMMMPQLLHALKMADEAKLDRPSLYGSMAVAVAAAVLASYWASLKIAYAKGALAMHPWFFISGPRGTMETLKSMLLNPLGIDLGRLFAIAAGGGFTWLLTVLRQRFLAFPLHPIGYVVGQGYEALRMWFPFLVGWTAKASVMKYGSVKTYRRLRPFFLGLVLGEYSAAGLWLVIDAITGRTGHRVFP